MCEQEGDEGRNETYGHSKHKHLEMKHVITGMLTDEYGIPIYEQTLDGNTSDNPSTIRSISIKRLLINRNYILVCKHSSHYLLQVWVFVFAGAVRYIKRDIT